MILVKIRCRKCRRLLDTIERRPSDWTEHRVTPACERCVGRRDHPSISGDETFTRITHFTVPWERFRPLIERAEATGRVSYFDL